MEAVSRETSSGGEDQISGNGMLGSYGDHESWGERYIGVGIPSLVPLANVCSQEAHFLPTLIPNTLAFILGGGALGIRGHP